MKRPILFTLAASALLLGACSEVRDVRFVGSLNDPYCAPDGSVVFGIFPTTEGSYQPIKSTPENCTWHAERQDAPRPVEVAAN